MMEGVTVHYASEIEDVLAVALPLLAARPQMRPAAPRRAENAPSAASAVA
jgi:hypothetical protein